MVLVVDDEPAIRQMLEDILGGEGHQVVTVPDGRAALQRLHDGLLPCLILLDLMMPRLNGWQLAAHLRADPRLRPIPFVLIAANPRFAAETEALGARKWLGKPINLEDLLQTVEEFCGRAA
ncbi:MAG: response regulator [Chloroflexota bacterium]|nr:response regulator [Chloroflexota bacterium]